MFKKEVNRGSSGFAVSNFYFGYIRHDFLESPPSSTFENFLVSLTSSIKQGATVLYYNNNKGNSSNRRSNNNKRTKNNNNRNDLCQMRGQ